MAEQMIQVPGTQAMVPQAEGNPLAGVEDGLKTGMTLAQMKIDNENKAAAMELQRNQLQLQATEKLADTWVKVGKLPPKAQKVVLPQINQMHKILGLPPVPESNFEMLKQNDDFANAVNGMAEEISKDPENYAKSPAYHQHVKNYYGATTEIDPIKALDGQMSLTKGVLSYKEEKMKATEKGAQFAINQERLAKDSAQKAKDAEAERLRKEASDKANIGIKQEDLSRKKDEFGQMLPIKKQLADAAMIAANARKGATSTASAGLEQREKSRLQRFQQNLAQKPIIRNTEPRLAAVDTIVGELNNPKGVLYKDMVRGYEEVAALTTLSNVLPIGRENRTMFKSFKDEAGTFMDKVKGREDYTADPKEVAVLKERLMKSREAVVSARNAAIKAHVDGAIKTKIISPEQGSAFVDSFMQQTKIPEQAKTLRKISPAQYQKVQAIHGANTDSFLRSNGMSK